MLFYSPCLSEVTLSRDRRSQASLGAHYIARYSLCLREGIRSTFAQNVVCTVHICTDLASIFCAVQSVSAPDPLPAKDVLCIIIRFVVRNRVKINKAGFAGIALFLAFNLDTD